MTLSCRLEARPDGRDVEFVAYTYPPSAVFAALPMAPGAVLYESEAPTVLHVAPGRWFAPAASAATRSLLLACVAHGALVEVEGKRSRLDLCGPGATAVLCAAIDILAVLEGRGCAAVVLFDCPCWVARLADGYALWTHASYRPHLWAELHRLTAA
ncbi:MAG: hypothetical protein WCP04_05025 [Pseudomonadota bacterium]|jgi:hypothetical protein